EGALTRVLAYADLSGQPLTAEMVEITLADMIPQRVTTEPTQIVSAVAAAYGLKKEQLLGRDRSRDVALPRQIAMYLMREVGNASLPQIGEAVGGRDHTTVMYACDKIKDLIERDDRLRRQVLQLREQLYGNR
ncbi:MAG: helix-turn-helix domain-containing protein, partial [Bellilinea sp.]